MTELYEQLARGAALLAATREASLASLRLLREPGRPTRAHLWAGFVAAGDWRQWSPVTACPTRV